MPIVVVFRVAIHVTSRESHMFNCLKTAISLNHIENNQMQNIDNLSIDVKSDTTKIRAI